MFGLNCTSGKTSHEIKMTRTSSDSNSTIGEMIVDDAHKYATCEDEYRTTKIAGETRIPAGRYKL
ncbi:MAG: hypothetical protein BV459_08220, partial [Thermoplasmata archaeon M11B2D]